MRKFSIIGKRLSRVDGPVKANGEAKYTVDVNLPGMLYGKILRSPYPHAKISNIDAPKIHEHCEGNISWKIFINSGDVEKVRL